MCVDALFFGAQTSYSMTLHSPTLGQAQRSLRRWSLAASCCSSSVVGVRRPCLPSFPQRWPHELRQNGRAPRPVFFITRSFEVTDPFRLASFLSFSSVRPSRGSASCASPASCVLLQMTIVRILTQCSIRWQLPSYGTATRSSALSEAAPFSSATLSQAFSSASIHPGPETSRIPSSSPLPASSVALLV